MDRYHIFDLDGTLVDSMTKWSDAMVHIIKHEKLECPENIINILTPIGYKKSAEYIKAMGASLSIEEILDMIHTHAMNSYTNEIELKPYVKEYLLHLRELGCKLYVLTASPHLFTDVCLKRNGVYDLFEQIWSTDDFGLPKSNPEIYYNAADRIGAPVSEITFYDDNLTALSTAAKAGLHTVAVYDDTSKNDREPLTEISDKYVETMKELL
jgi:HAD superfamily hydrolase (TIGR01509 family)